MTAPTLYIAGPMSGMEESNYPVFRRAGLILIAAGYKVANPVDADDLVDEITVPKGDRDWAWYIGQTMPMMLRSDGIALLPGWHRSKGSLIESDAARRVGKEVHDLAYWVERAVTGQPLGMAEAIEKAAQPIGLDVLTVGTIRSGISPTWSGWSVADGFIDLQSGEVPEP